MLQAFSGTKSATQMIMIDLIEATKFDTICQAANYRMKFLMIFGMSRKNIYWWKHHECRNENDVISSNAAPSFWLCQTSSC